MKRHRHIHHLPIRPAQEEERKRMNQEKNDHGSADQDKVCKQKRKTYRNHVLVGSSGCICRPCDSVWQDCDHFEEHSEELFAFAGKKVSEKCFKGSTSFPNECNIDTEEEKEEEEEEIYGPSRNISNDAMVEFDIKPEKSARYDMHTLLSSQRGMIEKILRDELRERNDARVFFGLTIDFSSHFANGYSFVDRKSRQQNFDTPLKNLHSEHDVSFCIEKAWLF